jgi:predicted unusual protein kinase regulating ubiquinone biosynthesis (AarF/ABC1/UbiB family)
VLYPDLDIWQTGKPVLKAWMRDQTGPRATLRRLRRDWPDMRYALEKLPLVARKLVDEALEGEAGGQTGNDADREIQRAVASGHAGSLVVGRYPVDQPPPCGWGCSANPAGRAGWSGGAGLLSLWLARPKV